MIIKQTDQIYTQPRKVSADIQSLRIVNKHRGRRLIKSYILLLLLMKPNTLKRNRRFEEKKLIKFKLPLFVSFHNYINIFFIKNLGHELQIQPVADLMLLSVNFVHL